MGSNPVSKLILLDKGGKYSVFEFLGGFFGNFLGGRRYNLIFIGDDGGVGISTDDPGVIHEVVALESFFVSEFGFDGGDFGFG